MRKMTCHLKSQRIMGTTVNTAEAWPGSSIDKFKSRPTSIFKTGRPPVAHFAWFVAAYNVLVILWGAYVRATGSGAGCGSHWPLCNGVIIPATGQTQTLIEFTHRVTSAVSVVLVVILLIWCWRRTAKRIAVVGKGFAVLQSGKVRISGFVAWLVWVAVHLQFLATSSLRLSVFLQWKWTSLTGQRGDRLIVSQHGSEVTKPGLDATVKATFVGRLNSGPGRTEGVKTPTGGAIA